MRSINGRHFGSGSHRFLILLRIVQQASSLSDTIGLDVLFFSVPEGTLERIVVYGVESWQKILPLVEFGSKSLEVLCNRVEDSMVSSHGRKCCLLLLSEGSIGACTEEKLPSIC